MTASANAAPRGPLFFLGFTAIAAAVAATAAFASVALSLAPWAMFVGWVAFFTRAPSAREGAASLATVLLGLVFGVCAVLALGALAPILGKGAIVLVVFVVAMLVVSLRAAPVINNVLGYFLGLIAVFAAHLEPSLASLAELGGACALGSVAGWASHAAQRRLAA
ncbi:Protein of unknown function (DUF1097) [Caulobacter sp. AP07]|uniref:DUF1097 domain-containing protein n=1 Tax=Caulobacter sp. AP07 TaxID=1144304 RepID=UPI00027211C4|nr:DUF1097 domain-containing protein [Caulobacter sp. AP07]EJL21850.1 Protein of unknown function (DUF1097) [Caulobacter sp. AP07]